MRGRGARAGIGVVAALAFVLLVLPAAAQANQYGYLFKELFGTAAQPSFTEPRALAVDPASGDLLVLDTTAKTISRYKPNGEADNFSALGSNTIDGKGGADKTPQEGFTRPSQIAVDGSCSEHEPPLSGSACTSFDPANGDIYLSDESANLVDVFSSAGEYLGQLTEASSDEVQKVELAGLSEGEDFSLSGLPGACSGSATPEIPSSPVAVEALRAALESQCGAPSFGIKSTLTLRVEFTGELGDADQRQLDCFNSKGPAGVGFCSVSTLVPGDATHNEVQQVTLEGFSGSEEFAFSNLPESSEACDIGQTANVHLTANLAADVRKALERGGRCGPNFSVSFTGASAAIDFAGPLGAADQAQLSCAAADTGACAVSTSQAGGQPRPFGSVGGLAVDPTGALYVAELLQNEIHKFHPTSNAPYAAETLTNFYSPRVVGLAAGVGPTAGFIFAKRFGELVKLDSSSGARRYAVKQREGIEVAVDSADGTVFSGNESELNQYDASGATEATLLAHLFPWPPHSGEGVNLLGLAVDPAGGALYLSRDRGAKISVYERVTLPEATSEAATAVGPGEATLNGKVSAAGGPSASCQLEYITEAAFNAPLGQGENGFKGAKTAPCAPPGPFTGSGSEAISATVEGLAPGTDYRFRVVATNKGGSSLERPGGEASLHFKTLGPAILEEESSEIGETEATISAQVDPNGEPTAYAVEYVAEAEYLKSGFNHALSEPTPPQPLGSGEEFLAVQQRLTGLDPGTAYRYRIGAANAAAAVHGEALRFATYAVQPTVLPDGRAYEKVTPSGKKGEPISPEQASYIGGSCDPTNPCLPGGLEQKMPMQAAPDGEAVLYEGQPFAAGLAQGANQYLSQRSVSGWDWQSLSPGAQTGFWVASSADLSRGVLAQTEPTLSPAAPTREGKAFANLYLRGEGEGLMPLVSSEPPHRDPGGSNRFQLRYSGANAGTGAVGALTHIVFEANDALTPAVAGIAPAAPTVAAGEQCSKAPCNLYEWANGQLRLVNVKPGNTEALGGSVVGSGRLLETVLYQEQPDTNNAISADGRFVFFSSEETGRLYVRIGAERTLLLPGLGTCKKSNEAAERVCFLTASSSGRRALLSNGQLDAINEAETSYGKAFDLTEGKEGFQGILGASEDLSRIYFADAKALPGAEASAEGKLPTEAAGHVNLYYWHEGAARFIGALLASDNLLSGVFGDWRTPSGARSAQATPDGRYLTFMSKAPLTGYDNETAAARCSGSQTEPACFEVFEYAAASGRLSCPSCNPTGQAPLGESSLTRLSTFGETAPSHRQPENLPAEGEGRLFFESQDTLSPHDHNGHIQDVYEWEPKGVGSCTSEADEGGCVYLISSGRGPTDATFLDATPSGNDAFFIDRSRLVPSDKDDQLDLYDARVGGGFEEPEPPVPCEGQACKGASPPAPGEAPSAGSASFAGPGNEKQSPPACPKGTRRVARGGKSRCLKPHKHKPRKRKRAKRGQGGSR